MSGYEVAPVDAAQDGELFLDLRRASLGGDATNEALHRWQYQQAPELSDALVPRELRERAMVGWVSLQPHRLAIDGRVRRAGLLVNLVVVPEHRTALPALLLQRAAAEKARQAYDLSYGYPNRAALGGFLRAGHRKLGSIRRYVCPLRNFGSQLSRSGVARGLALIAGVAADTLSPAVRQALWRRRRSRYTFEWLDHADERLDGLWELAVANSRGRVVGDRSAAFIEWRMVRHPREAHELGILVDRQHHDTVIGYAAVLRQGRRARLDDFFALDGAYGPLFDALLAHLATEGTEAAELSYLGRSDVIRTLLRRGFRPREALRSVIVDAGRLTTPWLGEVDRWHLTGADGDL